MARPSSKYQSIVEETKFFPVRRALANLAYVAAFKSFITFLFFFSTLIALTMIRIDWVTGQQTISWIKASHATAGVALLDKRDTYTEVADYIDVGLPKALAELHATCPSCKVGITPKKMDLASLGLEAFICSDFDSSPSSNSYPSRDCARVDAAWERSPSLSTAPCCTNQTLISESVQMMVDRDLAVAMPPPPPPPLHCPCRTELTSSGVLYNEDGTMQVAIQGAPYAYPARYGLDACKADDGLPPNCNHAVPTSTGFCKKAWCFVDPLECNVGTPLVLSSMVPGAYYSYAACAQQLGLPLREVGEEASLASMGASEQFVEHRVRHEQFLLQLIVSRDLHMASISYHTHQPVADAPRAITAGASYWSFNYASLRTQAVLVVLLYALGILTMIHDWREVWAWVRADPELRPAKGLRLGLYGWLVKLPSVIAPLVLELLRPHLHLPDWVFWVTCVELLLSMRLVHEGTIIPALRRIIRVIEAAMPNIVALLTVLIPIVILTALMHAQLFGLFNAGFSDFYVSITRVVRTLFAPPPPSITEDESQEASLPGSELMYYVSTSGCDPNPRPLLQPADERVFGSRFSQWGTLVIRLGFGSFIVAILVGAFNKVSCSAPCPKAYFHPSLPYPSLSIRGYV